MEALGVVTVQEHERGRVPLGQNYCLRGEKEIRKENSDLSYLHNIHKVRLFIKCESHDRSLIVTTFLDKSCPDVGVFPEGPRISISMPNEYITGININQSATGTSRPNLACRNGETRKTDLAAATASESERRRRRSS